MYDSHGTDAPALFHYTDAVLKPPGEARDEALILRQILRAAGFSLFDSRPLQWASNLGDRVATSSGMVELAPAEFIRPARQATPSRG